MTLAAQLAKKPFVWGIDGGVSTGLAKWDRRNRKFVEILTLDFWAAYEHVLQDDPQTTEIIIEAPRLISPTFSYGESARRKREKIAGNIGGVKRESQLLADGFRRKGFTVTEEKPHGPKWPDEYFKRVTGWQGRTSQHGRDAGKLVFAT